MTHIITERQRTFGRATLLALVVGALANVAPAGAQGPEDPVASCMAPDVTRLASYDFIVVGELPEGLPSTAPSGAWTWDEYHCLWPVLEADTPRAVRSEPLGPADTGRSAAALGAGPRLGPASRFQLTIVPPATDDTNAPLDGCNLEATAQGAYDLARATRVEISVSCLLAMRADDRWDSTVVYDGPTYRGQGEPGPTTDAWAIEHRFDAYLRTHIPWAIGLDADGKTVATNRLATTWIHSMEHLGIADMEWSTVQAETRTDYDPGVPRHSVAQHELSHLLLDGAPESGHYPDDGWQKSACGTWLATAEGWQWTAFDNVMNYCGMYRGVRDYDSTFAPFDFVATLQANAQDTT